MLVKCSRCRYPVNHPFGIILIDGVCTGCITHSEKDELNWELKRSELETLLAGFKKNHRRYDCVVPVIGDAEDYYTISQVIDLGLSPLIVCVNDYFKNDIGWHNFHNLITHFDLDSLVYNPDVAVYRDLIRSSLRKFDHVLLPFLQLHTSFPVHVANERKIPLVIWGQNQAIEQVGKYSHLDAVEMSRWNRREHDLFGTEIDHLIGSGAQVSERSLNYYTYPSPSILCRRGVRGIYLSNYMRWDPLAQNKRMTAFGFIPESRATSFDIYERAGSSVYYNIHDILKYKRCGIRKVDDHLAREIRHGRISTHDGSRLADAYTKTKVNVKEFFDWLDVTASGYDWYLQHRLYQQKHLLTESKDEPASDIELPFNLKEFILKSNNAKSNYVTFGKGIDIKRVNS